MFRYSKVRGFYNRAELKTAVSELSQNGKLNILRGPPSSGKTALVWEATKEVWAFRLDLRGYGTDERDALVTAFKDALLEVIQPWKSVGKQATEAAGEFFGLSTAFNVLNEMLTGQDLSPLDVVRIFDRTLTEAVRKREDVFIFIDEYSELFSKGKEHLFWKDEFAHNLEKVLVKHTKQASHGYVTALITSSDQQYYDHFTDLTEKEFAESFYLGYMSERHVLEYLENELKVKDEARRRKIAEYAGGHFTVLQKLAASENLDATIHESKMENIDRFELKYAHLSPDSRRALREIVVPGFRSAGFVPSKEVLPAARNELIARNMVTIRSKTTNDLWSPDLPDASRKYPSVLTPFVPTQRHVLGEVSLE